MSEEQLFALRLTNKQVLAWLPAEHQSEFDKTMLEKQADILSSINFVMGDGRGFFKQPTVTFDTPFNYTDKHGNDFWVVWVTLTLED